jgi:hypothetical protein
MANLVIEFAVTHLHQLVLEQVAQGVFVGRLMQAATRVVHKHVLYLALGEEIELTLQLVQADGHDGVLG